MADNNTSPEVIFPICFDGLRSQTWGGMTFVIHAAVVGTMPPGDFGIDGGWGGTRVTKSMVKKFYPDIEGNQVPGPFVSPVYLPKKSTYPVIYVPGSHQGWDPSNTSTVLASVNSDGKYEGYLNFADAGTQFKFCEGPNWDNNYGDDGADGTLDRNGANIVAADAGYYKINVDLNALTYTFLKTDWGVIGSATEGGWDSDQNMTYDPATGLWSAVLDLAVGDIKFRANDGWDLNYGDDGVNGSLEQNGANIAIGTAGTYTVTLKLGVPDYTYTIVRASYDRRAMFYTSGQNLEIENIFASTDGYAVTKFTNLTSTGANGSDMTFVDTDFALFRLADIYLMYAEAVLRGGNGTIAKALDLVNQVRTRAYTDESGNISQADLTLDFILDERARELYWEGTRRTDLVRFGKFSGGEYLWEWKGAVANGAATDSKFDIFPIPSADLGANLNLVQNPGY
ncbi:MAG: RagB/SusD family nutrient uptake outer membrane protein [Bacteroidota bacterium]